MTNSQESPKLVQKSDKSGEFNETIVISDDQSWIWELATRQLSQLDIPHVRLPSTVPLRHSWERFRRAKHMIIHWECTNRSGGAIVEEILSIQPNFDISGRVIVLTTHPTHEDVVQFAELGVTRIVRLRQREQELAAAGRELDMHLTASAAPNPTEELWRKLQRICDSLSPEAPKETLQYIEQHLAKLAAGGLTARYHDIEAKLHAAKGNEQAAVASWHESLDKNPKFYRAYDGLIALYKTNGKLAEALALLQKLQTLCRQSTSRLVSMAEIHTKRQDFDHAEFCFRSALERDAYCSGALSGLAELRFHAGDLEQARSLLSRSQLVHRTASNLNQHGVELVNQRKYKEALEHYTKAQYVLPQQDKSALLFYNIGLCYARWGQALMACEFLRIALIKDPMYKKAQRLLARLQSALERAPQAA